MIYLGSWQTQVPVPIVGQALLIIQVKINRKNEQNMINWFIPTQDIKTIYQVRTFEFKQKYVIKKGRKNT